METDAHPPQSQVVVDFHIDDSGFDMVVVDFHIDDSGSDMVVVDFHIDDSELRPYQRQASVWKPTPTHRNPQPPSFPGPTLNPRIPLVPRPHSFFAPADERHA